MKVSYLGLLVGIESCMNTVKHIEVLDDPKTKHMNETELRKRLKCPWKS